MQEIDDPKYAGQRISRKELQDESESSQVEEPEETDDVDDSESSEEEDVEALSENESTEETLPQETTENDNKEPEQSRTDDLKKAKAVKRQGVRYSTDLRNNI